MKKSLQLLATRNTNTKMMLLKIRLALSFQNILIFSLFSILTLLIKFLIVSNLISILICVWIILWRLSVNYYWGYFMTIGLVWIICIWIILLLPPSIWMVGKPSIFQLSVSIQVIESYFNLWSKFRFSLIHSYWTNFFKIIEQSQGV